MDVTAYSDHPFYVVEEQDFKVYIEKLKHQLGKG